MGLQGKVAIVTGGGTGMGRAIALRFAREGAAVAINYSKSQRQAEEAARQAKEAGGAAVAIRADVSREVEARALIDQAVAQFGRLDILVNNAGWSTRVPHRDLDALTDEIWDRTMAVNLKGAFYCVRAAVPAMLKAGGGSIINITSVAGFTGSGSSIAYCASKAGLTSLTKSLARALAPEIRVNAIAPGFVDTGFAGWPREVMEGQRQVSPMGRIAEPDDVAEIALFLAAEARAVTGHTIFADAGITALGPRI